LKTFTISGVPANAVKVTHDADLFGKRRVGTSHADYAVLEGRIDVEALRNLTVKNVSDDDGELTESDDAADKVARTKHTKISLEPNPRAQNLDTQVAKRIRESLLKCDGRFHWLNRGVLQTARTFAYDNVTKELSWDEEDPKVHGNLDGGHTLRLIDEIVGSAEWKTARAGADALPQFVTLQIVKGLPPDDITDIARARNTSINVEEYALRTLERKFEFVEKVLEENKLRQLVAFKQFEIRGEEKELDIVQLLQRLTVLDNKEFDDDQKQPYSAYWSRAKTVKEFVLRAENYHRLQKLIPDALALAEYITLKYQEWYLLTAGKTGSGKPKFGATRECKAVADKDMMRNVTELHVLPIVRPGSPDKVGYQLKSDGLPMPILAALRTIVSPPTESGDARWLTDPYEFLDEVGPSLVDSLTGSINFARNVTVALKEKGTWKAVYMQARTKVLESRLVEAARH
jgi:AIPR protein